MPLLSDICNQHRKIPSSKFAHKHTHTHTQLRILKYKFICFKEKRKVSLHYHKKHVKTNAQHTNEY